MTKTSDIPNEGDATPCAASEMPYPTEAPRFGYDPKMYQFGQKVGLAEATMSEVHAAQQKQIFALTDALHAKKSTYALVRISTESRPVTLAEVTAEIQGVNVLAAGLALMEIFINGGRSALEDRVRNHIGDREELATGLSAAKAHVASLNVFGV